MGNDDWSHCACCLCDCNRRSAVESTSEGRGDDGSSASWSALLTSIKYPPVAAVVVVYPDSAFKVW